MAKLKGSFVFEHDYTDYMTPGGREREKQREEQFFENLRNELRAKHSGDSVGKELQWPRGDGCARYIVVSETPFVVAHLNIGDAWTVEPALIRGLRLSDARNVVERSERFAMLFGGE